MGITQRSGHPVAFRHGDRQTGMANESGWLYARDRLIELQADAAVAIGGEDQALVAERRMRRPGRLEEEIRPRDGDVGNVVGGLSALATARNVQPQWSRRRGPSRPSTRQLWSASLFRRQLLNGFLDRCLPEQGDDKAADSRPTQCGPAGRRAIRRISRDPPAHRLQREVLCHRAIRRSQPARNRRRGPGAPVAGRRSADDSG
jgi:hypothetical protein